MTQDEWIREYKREKEKEFPEMFDWNVEPMFKDPEVFDTYVEKFPIGMKRKFVFYEFPYWENLMISQLLGPIHIFKII